MILYTHIGGAPNNKQHYITLLHLLYKYEPASFAFQSRALKTCATYTIAAGIYGKLDVGIQTKTESDWCATARFISGSPQPFFLKLCGIKRPVLLEPGVFFLCNMCNKFNFLLNYN